MGSSAANSPHLQHHFADLQQQRESAKLGMWIFLVTEILLFGGLFCFYAIYRAWNPDVFYNAHRVLDIRLGTLNTVVLITSSLTIALAIRSIQLGWKGRSLLLLICTFLLALTFLIVKYFEYSHKFHLGQLPGKYYTYSGIEGTNPHIFFSAYFLMTGLHGIHVIAGMSLIGWLIFRTRRGDFSAEWYTPVEMTGLYWHLVDLIWIYLFPLFYLVG
jgi:cytochrome c oxidase subunit 3